MSGGVPAGWVLVPVEPTEAMVDRFVSRALCVSVHGDGGWSKYARQQWATMLAAVPATPTPPIEGRDADVERVEKVARALAQRFIDRGKARVTGSTYERWEEMPGSYKRDFYDDARAALQALGERG